MCWAISGLLHFYIQKSSISLSSPAQDHGAAAAFPWDLRQPGEDPAARAGLVEAPVHTEGGEAQSGRFEPGATAQWRQSFVKGGQIMLTSCECYWPLQAIPCALVTSQVGVST